MPAPPLTATSRLARSPSVVEVVRDGTTVLVDMHAGRRITLDALGARVWTALASDPTVAEVTRQVRGDRSLAAWNDDDMAALLVQWRAMGLIRAGEMGA